MAMVRFILASFVGTRCVVAPALNVAPPTADDHPGGFAGSGLSRISISAECDELQELYF